MSLLFSDGVDHHTTVLQKWTAYAGYIDIGASAGRFGGGAVRHTTGSPTASRVEASVSNPSTVIAGCAVFIVDATSCAIMGFKEGGQPQVQLRVDAGYLRAYVGTTLVGSSSSAVVSANTWNYYEMKSVLHGATGSIEVHLNGVAQITLSGIDTTYTANAWADAVFFGGHSYEIYGYLTAFDDFYICDAAGSRCNDFLDDIRISTTFPNADGSNSGFTSTGGDQYSVIDETTPNSDADYLYSSTVSARSTVNMQNISIGGGAVKAVQVNVFARKDDVDTRAIKTTVKSGATYELGSEAALGISYAYVQSRHEVDPNTSTAWTETTVNAAEFGIDLTT